MVLLAVGIPSCAGAEFKVEGPLREAPPLRLDGTLGMSAYDCMSAEEHQKSETLRQGLNADQESSLSIGSWRGVASAPHRKLTSTKLFGERAREDFRRFAERIRTPLGASTPRQVNELLDAIEMVLSLPGKIEQTMSFSVLAEREGRVITAICASTDWTHLAGFFDSVKFSLGCRVLSSADDVPRDLRVSAYGAWTNATFAGDLNSPHESARFASQNVSMMGMGGVRGFDLRSLTGTQVAALSFWHVNHAGERAEPRAWLSHATSPGWSDAMLTALAIGYLYPWPTACDAQRMRTRALQNVSDELSRTGR